MKERLLQRIQGESLSFESAKSALLSIGRGEVNPAQTAAFLSSYWYHPIQVQELQGFAEAMLELAVNIDLSAFDPMDVCGTGGDGKDTFNISTTASFLVAGAGQRVAKHGNHGVSSAVGSSTVLEFLGLKFTADPAQLIRKMETAGICFLHAPLFHPAMRFVGPIRKELGIKTFFNLLGPLLNPAKVKKQITGVFSLEVFDLYHAYFKERGQSFGILYAHDGYDEISLTGSFQLATPAGVQVYEPEALGFPQVQAQDLAAGNSVEDSADTMYKILRKEGSAAQTNVVLANAAAALWVAGKAQDFQEGLWQARESLESGKAFQVFKKFIMD